MEIISDKQYEQLVSRVEQELLDEMQPLMSDKADFHKFAQDTLDSNRAKEQWDLLDKFLSQFLKSSSQTPYLLEIGSGFGTFASYASKQGLKVYGIEPSASRIDISQGLFHLNSTENISIENTPGETLPFPDDFFDVIYSSNVLEHVHDPQAVLEEAVRVLKPGGILQFVIPNYGSWWEGHYGILWIPNLSKALAKFYVGLYGRDQSYVDTLNLINRAWLERMVQSHENTIEILSWGDRIWEERLKSLTFSGWATLATLKNIVQLLHSLGLVKLVLWLGKLLHWETPFVLTLRKL